MLGGGVEKKNTNRKMNKSVVNLDEIKVMKILIIYFSLFFLMKSY